MMDIRYSFIGMRDNYITNIKQSETSSSEMLSDIMLHIDSKDVKLNVYRRYFNMLGEGKSSEEILEELVVINAIEYNDSIIWSRGYGNPDVSPLDLINKMRSVCHGNKGLMEFLTFIVTSVNSPTLDTAITIIENELYHKYPPDTDREELLVRYLKDIIEEDCLHFDMFEPHVDWHGALKDALSSLSIIEYTTNNGDVFVTQRSYFGGKANNAQ